MMKKRFAGLLLAMIFVLTAAVIPVLATGTDDGDNKDNTTIADTTNDNSNDDGSDGAASNDGGADDAAGGENDGKDSEDDSDDENADDKSETKTDDKKGENKNTTDDTSIKISATERITSTIPSIEVELDVDTEYVILTFSKEEDSWSIVDQVFVNGEQESVPTVVTLSPESEKLHGSINVEYNEESKKWEVAKENYYGSKLMIIPFAVIAFLVILAFTVFVNLIIIKIHKR